MAKPQRPGSRQSLLDSRGNIDPQWSRYFSELSGATANIGDILVVGAGGAEFMPPSETTFNEDIEFEEHWRN